MTDWKPESCWVWTGAKNSNGYGVIRDANSRNSLAHRISYQLFKGKLNGKSEIDHICEKRDCVNPRHLRIVNRAQNVQAIHWKDARELSRQQNHLKDI
tara:strand:- start:353 stop:646 length:294 start_codon:yes stop_codon:yes gene_type:complete